MNDDLTPSEDSADEALPPRLREALVRLDGNEIRVPPALDARILSQAKNDYARRLRFRPVLRWVAAAASLAAAIAIVFVLRATLSKPQTSLAKANINVSGRGDMLDAYRLAKHISAGDKLDPKWDANGDGVVDQHDVDWIADHAVQISPANTPAGGAQ